MEARVLFRWPGRGVGRYGATVRNRGSSGKPVGNPFDAKAARGSEVLYLEAKGTVTDGQRVIVTRGEVNWAQQDPGECVLGILSGIAIRSDGSVDHDSGTLHRYTWNPDNDDLDPLAYDYYPPDEAQIE